MPAGRSAQLRAVACRFRTQDRLPSSHIGRSRHLRLTGRMAVTLYGVCAVTFMMVMYALEGRGRGFVLAFAVGCVLSSIYGFLSGAWPFGVVELIWAAVALRRYREPIAA
jgi:hypothetical protein